VLLPAPCMRARTLTPGDTNDPHFGLHCPPVERLQCAPGMQDAHQMSKCLSRIDQVDEHDRVGRGDHLVWTDAQEVKVGVQALERARDTTADTVEIQMAHRKGDQAQTIRPGCVEQESTQEIEEAIW
jgi:hypothetical protein